MNWNEVWSFFTFELSADSAACVCVLNTGGAGDVRVCLFSRIKGHYKLNITQDVRVQIHTGQ